VKAPPAEEVANGVDAPRHVVEKGDSHQPAPQKRGERAAELARQRVSEAEREDQASSDDRDE
jgi:hypothetical protein